VLLGDTFGAKRGGREVQKHQHNEELHSLYSSPNIIGDQIKDEMAGACSTQEDKNANDLFHFVQDKQAPIAQFRAV
jgi:hypothetical protein